jgi:hypothetical protein
MFDNLKAGDTIKIGEREFKLVYPSYENHNMVALSDGKENISLAYSELKFLGAEIVRKAPPKYTPVKSGLGSFALSSGKLDQFGHLLVLVDNYFENWPIWEVLEIEK